MMKRLVSGSDIVMLAAMLFALAADAQPGNDAFANRQLIGPSVTDVSGTLSNATYEAGEPFIPEVSSGQTAWWSWVAPSNGSLALSLSTSNFSPLVTVYSGDALSNLALVASNNYLMCYSDGTCGCHWRVRQGTSFRVAKGEAYQICVDSAVFTDASRSFSIQDGIVVSFLTNVVAGGNFQMRLDFTPAPKKR